MNKKILITIVIILILIGIGVWYFLFYNKSNQNGENEIIPEEEISEEQIDKSVSKILDLKYDLLEEENIYTKEYLGSISHQEIISKITS